MTTLVQELRQMHRPCLLLQAARIGAGALIRAGRDRAAGVQGSVNRLLSEEAELEVKRIGGEASYSPRRHVELLMSLLAVAQGARTA
jgi:uncharacterized protein DUF6477